MNTYLLTNHKNQQPKKMKTSSLFSLDFKDLGKGLLVAIGGAVITAIENSISAGSLTFNWKAIGSVALAAGLSYLGKNFFTPAQTITPAQ
jgi:hypothetical protein